MEPVDAKLILSSKYLEFTDWKQRNKDELRVAWGKSKSFYVNKASFKSWCENHYIECQNLLKRTNLHK